MPDSPDIVIGGDVVNPFGIVPPPANITAFCVIDVVDPLCTTCIEPKLFAYVAVVAVVAAVADVAVVAFVAHELVPNKEDVILVAEIDPVTPNDPVI